MKEGSEEWFWCKLARELGLPYQFCQQWHTVDDFFRWIDFFTIENERENRKQASHEKSDHLVARVCLEIERLAHRILRLKGALPNDLKKHLLQYRMAEVAQGNGNPPQAEKTETTDDIVQRTIRHKAAMFATLGIKQQVKWEGPLPDGSPE